MKFLTYEKILGTYSSKEVGNLHLQKYAYWFPLGLCPNIAGIVADLMGDGHLQKGRM